MNKQRKSFTLALLVMTLFSFKASSASFDCDKASTSIEKMICANDVLSSLDSSMASLYEAKKDKNLTKSQRMWISDVRNKSTTSDELITSYADRIKYLSNYNGSAKLNDKNETKPQNTKNNGKLKIHEFTGKYANLGGMKYSTQYQDMTRSSYVLRCTDATMIDLMNILKKEAIKNGQASEFSKYRDNIYTAMWNYMSDDLESQINDPRMRTMCDLLIAGTRY
ncbi:Uncharacterized protein conserved in bacteria, putative lipoprotein [Providencia rustigianii]|nr:Uncharacterized protein conserved in bacteria, putative lipoprotein [Providencia rustigianii]